MKVIIQFFHSLIPPYSLILFLIILSFSFYPLCAHLYLRQFTNPNLF